MKKQSVQPLEKITWLSALDELCVALGLLHVPTLDLQNKHDNKLQGHFKAQKR
jgi:hypothetical protein